ncbi:MAG: parvulin-like peptidyl-prolyl isomerase [Bacteriovoracaceae bacterium]
MNIDSRRKYKARHILVEDLEDAEYVLKKINEGEDFSVLARDLSECDSATKGGVLPSFRSGQMVAEFERAVHNLEFNEVSGPIKSEHGFHIIQRLKL